MHARSAPGKTLWSIVVGDDHGPEWAPYNHQLTEPCPIQYCRLDDSSTLLQKAIRRATRVAPTSQVIVTARTEYRAHWEPALWFVNPEYRIVGNERCSSWVTTAAALLAILTRSPSSIVAVFPARSFVTHEQPLAEAVDRAIRLVPQIPEGIVTLGMIDIHDGIDEDYLIPAGDSSGSGLVLRGVAKQPVSWIAQHLKRQGAVVASEILIGYVGALVAHVTRTWPGLYSKLYKFQMDAKVTGGETVIPESVRQGLSSGMLRSFRWYPPSLPQRATVVRYCGWSSLRTARVVARIGAVVGSSINEDQNVHFFRRAISQSRDQPSII